MIYWALHLRDAIDIYQVMEEDNSQASMDTRTWGLH